MIASTLYLDVLHRQRPGHRGVRQMDFYPPVNERHIHEDASRRTSRHSSRFEALLQSSKLW
jgi:hypothetical protein